VRSSNAGHVLFAGLALEKRAASVVRTLMSRSSFSGWGIRTIATTEARYNPMSYHNGSVWPHDNALIAAGFARYGFRREAARLFEGLFAASVYFDMQRLPELFCGFARQHRRSPTFYPVACVPQAWAAATPLSLLQSCLGLAFDPAGGQVTFDRPVLPSFVDDVVLRRLLAGPRSVEVKIARKGARIVAKTISS
jgi:glycogen debranching enzyme